MVACPICRASLNGASVCRRCRAELGKVREIEQRGLMLALTAMRMLVEGDAGSAVRWLGRARSVHATPAVRTLERLALTAGAADQTE